MIRWLDRACEVLDVEGLMELAGLGWPARAHAAADLIVWPQIRHCYHVRWDRSGMGTGRGLVSQRHDKAE
jgi:hypothetical protein